MAQIDKLYDKDFIATDLREGDALNIGAAMISTDFAPKLQADFNRLPGLLSKFDHAFSATDMTGLTDHFATQGLKADPETYANLYLLQKVMEKHVWPKLMQNDQDRLNLYREAPVTGLSTAFERGQMACAELSMLSMKILQDRGYDVKMISGGFVRREVAPNDDAFNEPHAFLAIEQPDNEQVLIFDPANPVHSQDSGQFASVFAVSKHDFDAWNKKARTDVAFMALREEFSGRVKYYGASSANLVFWPERHVAQTGQAGDNGTAAPTAQAPHPQ